MSLDNSENPLLASAQLEKTKDEICEIVNGVINATCTEAFLEKSVDDVLFLLTGEWAENAQPMLLQEKEKEKATEELVIFVQTIRRLGLNSLNNYNRADLALKIVDGLHTVFTGIPEFDFILRGDKEALRNIEKEISKQSYDKLYKTADKVTWAGVKEAFMTKALPFMLIATVAVILFQCVFKDI